MGIENDSHGEDRITVLSVDSSSWACHCLFLQEGVNISRGHEVKYLRKVRAYCQDRKSVV